VELRSIFKAQEISQDKYYGRQKDRGRKATQEIDTFLTGTQWTGVEARPEDSLRETAQAIQAVMYARIDGAYASIGLGLLNNTGE